MLFAMWYMLYARRHMSYSLRNHANDKCFLWVVVLSSLEGRQSAKHQEQPHNAMPQTVLEIMKNA